MNSKAFYGKGKGRLSRFIVVTPPSGSEISKNSSNSGDDSLYVQPTLNRQPSVYSSDVEPSSDDDQPEGLPTAQLLQVPPSTSAPKHRLRKKPERKQSPTLDAEPSSDDDQPEGFRQLNRQKSPHLQPHQRAN